MIKNKLRLLCFPLPLMFLAVACTAESLVSSGLAPSEPVAASSYVGDTKAPSSNSNQPEEPQGAVFQLNITDEDIPDFDYDTYEQYSGEIVPLDYGVTLPRRLLDALEQLDEADFLALQD